MEEFQDLRLPFRFFTLTFTLFLYFGSEPVGAGSGSGIRYLGVGAGSGSRLFKFLTGSASLLTLRIFLIFHLCGQFIKNWKNLKFLDEKIKVVETLAGIISIYLTLNLEEINLPLEKFFSCIFSWDSVFFGQKPQYSENEKIKVVENLTGIISIYLTLNFEEKIFSTFSPDT